MKRVKFIDKLKAITKSSRYIIIPKEIREELQIMTGDKLEIIMWKSEIKDEELITDNTEKPVVKEKPKVEETKNKENTNNNEEIKNEDNINDNEEIKDKENINNIKYEEKHIYY